MCDLPPNAELFDQPFVAIEVAGVQVVKQAPTLADQAQKPTARVMILLVRREVLGQLIDASREQRDLNFRRTAVVGYSSVGLDDFPLTG